MRTCVFAALILCCCISVADEERPNVPIVASGGDGTCYAKAVPVDVSGGKGATTIYNVKRGDDERAETYNWYAPGLHLLCNVWRHGRSQTTVARMGRWARGSEANDKDLAVAFYANGKLLNSYSTLDIAGTPDNVGASFSHYQVFGSVEGFQWTDSSKLEFRATRIDGTTVRFDPETGAILGKMDGAP